MQLKVIVLTAFTIISLNVSAVDLKDCQGFSDIYKSIAEMREMGVQEKNVHHELQQSGYPLMPEKTATALIRVPYHLLKTTSPDDTYKVTLKFCLGL